MKIREICGAGLRGATPEGGWSSELRPEDCVHALIAVHTDAGPVGLGSVFANDGLAPAAREAASPDCLPMVDAGGSSSPAGASATTSVTAGGVMRFRWSTSPSTQTTKWPLGRKRAAILGKLTDGRNTRGKRWVLATVSALVVLANLRREDRLHGIAQWALDLLPAPAA